MKILSILFIAFGLVLFAGCSTAEREYVAFADLKAGMTESELSKALGAPVKIENSADFVIWTYPVGTVFVREGKVYSWNVSEKRAN